jgi:hypothetical protein
MRKLLEGINIVTIYRKGGLASMDGFKNGNALKNIQNYFMPINGYFIPKIEHMVQLTRRDNSRQFLMAHSKMAPNSITNGICMSST